jgi:hypothetical protein
MPTVSGRDTGELLRALASELERASSARLELCVIGGAALAVLGLVDRPTKDIDVVALGDASSGALVVRKSKPLPETLVVAVRAVATQYGKSRGSTQARAISWTGDCPRDSRSACTRSTMAAFCGSTTLTGWTRSASRRMRPRTLPAGTWRI